MLSLEGSKNIESLGTFHYVVQQVRRLSVGRKGRDTDTAVDVYQDRRAYVWNNDHDTATLRDSRGRIADTKSWGRHGRH